MTQCMPLPLPVEHSHPTIATATLEIRVQKVLRTRRKGWTLSRRLLLAGAILLMHSRAPTFKVMGLCHCAHLRSFSN